MPERPQGYMGLVAKTCKVASGSLTADTDVIAAVVGKRIKVYAYAIFTFGTSANLLIFKSNGTSGTEVGRLALQAPTSGMSGANVAVSPPNWLFATAAGEKLTLDVNQSDTIHYTLYYFDDDVD